MAVCYSGPRKWIHRVKKFSRTRGLNESDGLPREARGKFTFAKSVSISSAQQFVFSMRLKLLKTSVSHPRYPSYVIHIYSLMSLSPFAATRLWGIRLLSSSKGTHPPAGAPVSLWRAGCVLNLLMAPASQAMSITSRNLTKICWVDKWNDPMI